ncbi:hypothetical protein GCM10010392_64290 [Streptomyces clavifer]|nr:hypothetical protein GCM10010392_64290 [Streptomyces clavifer]
MIFPVCVGKRWAPLAAVHRMGTVAGPVRRCAPGRPALCVRVERGAGYERPATVSRTLALISAGIGA